MNPRHIMRVLKRYVIVLGGGRAGKQLIVLSAHTIAIQLNVER